MMWFRSNQDEKLKQLLRNSGSDFRFNPNSVKYRLLASIESHAQKPAPSMRVFRVMKYSSALAAVAVVAAGTLAFASDAKPGDKLFELNKLGEQFILNLPLSPEQKAGVQEHIVTSRLEALDEVEVKIEDIDETLETVQIERVKETDSSLNTAVNKITENKKKLEAAGHTQAADKLEAVLDRLQLMAEKREAAIKAMQEKAKNPQTKTQLEKYKQQIQNSRLKAQREIKRYKTPIENENSGKSRSED